MEEMCLRRSLCLGGWGGPLNERVHRGAPFGGNGTFFTGKTGALGWACAYLQPLGDLKALLSLVTLLAVQW
jgi:hypothetical protein